MKTTVCTACVYPDKKPIWPAVASCARHHVELHAFGLGATHKGFVHTKVTRFLAFLKSVKTSHVLYFDGTDTLWVHGLREIEASYRRITEAQGKRMLVGSEWILYPFRQGLPFWAERAKAAGAKGPFIYQCPGFIMGETQTVREALLRIEASHLWDTGRKKHDTELWNDDMTYWQLCMEEGLVDPAIDYECEIAMVFGKLKPGMYKVDGQEVICCATGRRPHMLHFNRLRRPIVKSRMRELGKAVGYEVYV